MNFKCKRLLVVPIGLFGLFVLGFSLSAWAQTAQSAANVTAKTTAITTHTVSARAIEERIDTVGQIEAVQAPLVAAEISAKVLKVLVNIGDVVTPHTVLATLDAKPYALKLAEARSEVNRLDALIKWQATQVDRYKQILSRNGVDVATFDKAVAEKQSYVAQREYAQAQLNMAELTLQQTQIVSPIDGVVDSRLVSVGDYVVPGAPMFKVVGNDQLQARLPFSETLYARLQHGQTLHLSSVVRPNAPITTQIHFLRPQIESASRAIEVFARFNNTQHWLPGASVNGQLVLSQHADALVVPTRAIVPRPAGDVVYVVRASNVGNGSNASHAGFSVEERVVTLGINTPHGQHIVSGLQAGEIIALDGAAFLTGGAAVEVTP